jgi:hypothetical protein
MHNSKLIRLLRNLSKKELNRFGEFVHSPYFNKNTEFISFYDYILPFGPNFSHKRLSKEQVLKSFKKKHQISEQSITYWMNGLIQLLEQFLSIEKLQEDELQRQHYLIQSYQNHQLEKSASSVLKKAKTQLANHHLQNADFFYQSFQLSKAAYELESSNRQSFNEELQVVSNSLDVYYLAEKLRYCCEMINFENILNVKYDLQLGNQILTFLDDNPLAEVPVIAVYLNIFKMLQNAEKDEHYNKVKKLLIQYEDIFTAKEIKSFYINVLNYCTRRINQFNDEKYWIEYLDINKTLLEKGLLFEKGQLSPWRYTNLVNVGLKTNQIDWTTSFIEEYKEKLPTEYKESMFAYNSGLMQYYLKAYDQAQQLIFNIETKDVLLNVLNRSLLVKIYYESNQTELLLFSLEANRIFLLRNKLIDPKLKTQMKRFIDFTKKLVKIDITDADKLLPLKEKLPNASEVMHRDWLLEQMDLKIAKLIK